MCRVLDEDGRLAQYVLSHARFSLLIFVVTKSATTVPSLKLPNLPALTISLSLRSLYSVLRTTKRTVEERDELTSHSAI